MFFILPVAVLAVLFFWMVCDNQIRGLLIAFSLIAVYTLCVVSPIPVILFNAKVYVLISLLLLLAISLLVSKKYTEIIEYRQV
ncbi:MAG: hypothetical protein Nk1A_9130 [Endomicrobiia bacterium]|nr:MAG: hypothetical protein Nk1A_9130 [Endomicrobiia bacterium]